MMNELEHILSKRYKQEALFGLFQRYFVDWIADAYIAKDMNIFEISAINEKTDKEVLVKFLAEFYGNEEIFKSSFFIGNFSSQTTTLKISFTSSGKVSKIFLKISYKKRRLKKVS